MFTIFNSQYVLISPSIRIPSPTPVPVDDSRTEDCANSVLEWCQPVGSGYIDPNSDEGIRKEIERMMVLYPPGSGSGMKFNPNAKLDPSQVEDRRKDSFDAENCSRTDEDSVSCNMLIFNKYYEELNYDNCTFQTDGSFQCTQPSGKLINGDLKGCNDMLGQVGCNPGQIPGVPVELPVVDLSPSVSQDPPYSEPSQTEPPYYEQPNFGCGFNTELGYDPCYVEPAPEQQCGYSEALGYDPCNHNNGQPIEEPPPYYEQPNFGCGFNTELGYDPCWEEPAPTEPPYYEQPNFGCGFNTELGYDPCYVEPAPEGQQSPEIPEDYFPYENLGCGYSSELGYDPCYEEPAPTEPPYYEQPNFGCGFNTELGYDPCYVEPEPIESGPEEPPYYEQPNFGCGFNTELGYDPCWEEPTPEDPAPEEHYELTPDL